MSKNLDPTFILEKEKIFKDEKFLKSIREEGSKYSGVGVYDEKIIFKNCTFQKVISFDNLSLSNCQFDNCSFNDDVRLTDCDIEYLTFNNCFFKAKSTFLSNKIKNSYFFDCTAKGEMNIYGEYEELIFKNSTITKVILRDINKEYNHIQGVCVFEEGNKIQEIMIKSQSCYCNLFFSGNSIYDWIQLTGRYFSSIRFENDPKIEHLYIESAVVEERLDFRAGKFKRISFLRSSLNGLITLYGYDHFDKRENELDIYEISINTCSFQQDISAYLPSLNSLSITNTNFEELFHFDNFHKEFPTQNFTSIRLSSLKGNVLIENTNATISLNDINLANIYLKEISLFSLVFKDFQNLGNIFINQIKRAQFLIFQDSIVGNLNFFNEDLNIFDEIVVANSNLTGIGISNFPKNIRSYNSNPIMGYGIEDKSKDNQNLKSCYNQLKIVAKKNGDIIAMNRYQSLEFERILRIGGFSFDKVLLILNWLSNNFGNSWVRGVVFTIITSFIFCLIYLQAIDVSVNNLGSLKYFILYLTSFSKMFIEEYSSLNNIWYTSLIIWVARIFVGYGVYQTIVAFRKFGKF